MLGHRTLNVEDYLHILKRRWWIIAISTIVFAVGAIGFTYFVTPKYVSATLVLIDQQKVPADFVRSLATQPLDTRLAYMEEQILSRSQIQPIIEKYNLYGNQHLPMDARVDLVRKDLKIDAVQSEIAHSNGLPGFKIEFTANDPQTAQQVCSEVTSLFTKINLHTREEDARGTNDFLKEQLDLATRNLTDLDSKVAVFQREHAGMLPEDQSNNMSILQSLQSELDATTQQLNNLDEHRSMDESLLAQAQATQAALNVPAGAASPIQSVDALEKQLQTLREQEADLLTHYTAAYPDVQAVQRKIADLQQQISKADSAPAAVAPSGPKRPDSTTVVQLRTALSAIDQEISAKHKLQDQISQEIRSYQGKVAASPQVEAEYKELTRDYETAEAFQKKLLSDTNDSEMTTSLENRQEGEAFSVLDAASLPTDPIYPKRTLFAGGGVGAGIVFGLMIVALMEYRDTALRTERDVWDFTQLPTLAVIAWSGDVANMQTAKVSRLKRLFSRKPSKDLLADSTG